MVAVDADQPLAQGQERLARERELFFHRELRQVAGADDAIDAQPVRVADDLFQRLERAVVLAAAAFPQLHRSQSAQGAQLAQRSLAPARELHVRVGKMQDADHFSATASQPRPPSDSSTLTTRRPAASSAAQSASKVKRP